MKSNSNANQTAVCILDESLSATARALGTVAETTPQNTYLMGDQKIERIQNPPLARSLHLEGLAEGQSGASYLLGRSSLVIGRSS